MSAPRHRGSVAELGVEVRDGVPSSRPRTGEFSIWHRQGYWRDALRRRMLAAADIVSVLVASFALFVAFGGTLKQAAWIAALLPLWLVLAKLHGLYDRDHRSLRHLTADELSSLIAWATTGTAAAAVVLELGPAGAPSAPEAIRFWAVLVVAAPLTRAVARAIWRRLVPPERTLIVGEGPLEQATRRKVDLFRDIHIQVVGGLDDEDLLALRTNGDNVADALDAASAQPLDAASAQRETDRVILASSTIDEGLIADLIAYCRARAAKFSVVPPARTMFGSAVRLAHVAELPLIEYHTWDVPRSTKLLKRGLDILVSGMLLVALAPVLAVIAVLIRLDSRGPSFFVQRRAGLEGRPFRLYKFRTMVRDAEKRLPEVVSLETLRDPVFKLRSDPRVTRVGRFLRRTSLDELPQLFNVLKGDMSLVGPRPEQVELVNRYAPEHRFRLDLRPGLTGPMQVFGRGDLRFDERLAVERDYIENLSIGRDLRIILMTGSAVVRGKGAY